MALQNTQAYTYTHGLVNRRAHTNTHRLLHIPTDLEDKEAVFPSICVFVPCNLREQSLYEGLLPRGARNQSDEGELGPLRH